MGDSSRIDAKAWRKGRSQSRSSQSGNERERSEHDTRQMGNGKDKRQTHSSSRRRSMSKERSHDTRDRHDRHGRHRRTERTRERSRSPSPARRVKGPLPSQNDSFRNEVGPAAGDQPPKQKPNFKPTGLLAKEANTVAGTTTVLKYHEPAEARKPPPHQQWRMYIFKDKDLLDTIYLFERSCWLMGRDQRIADLYMDHPSISKQHAVIQFRHSSTTNTFGDKINRVRPYLIDLESANGTILNEKNIRNSRYVELVDGDVISFGHSDREYVMMLPESDRK